MRRFTRQLAFGVIAVLILLTSNESCLANGGGSWGSRGGSLGGGYTGGSWGGRSGVRTPVRDFFAYRRPVRNVLRGVRDAFSYRGGLGSYGGSRGWGGSGGYGSGGGYASGGNGSGGGYASGGNGSGGYQYYSSANTAYSSVGGSPSYSIPSIGSAGFISSPAATNNYPSFTTQFGNTSCPDCIGTGPSGISYGGSGIPPSTIPYNGDSGFIGSGNVLDGSTVLPGEAGIIPAEQYYDSGSPVIPTESSEGSSVRGFESPPTPQPANGDESTSTFRRRKDAILNINVPVDAIVYVNNHLTKTVGSNRSYVSRKLRNGKDYSFNVKVLAFRSGQEITLKKEVVMRAGRSQTVDFDFESPVLTQLTLRVPESATVLLCGNDTKANGSVRNFKTRLVPGQIWENYEIDVRYEIDGKTVKKKRQITIEAGQKYVVDFEAEQDLYVSR